MSAILMWMMAANGKGAWIPCPQSPMEAASEGISEETRLLNGGSYVVRTMGSRRKYDLIWSGTIAELQPVKDLFDGVYGIGPYFFLDPMATKNVLPPHWATPSLSGGKLWPTLVNSAVPVIAATTISSVYTPPPFAASYTLPSAIPLYAATTPKLLIPIPPTATLSLRLWGSVTGTATVQLRLTNRTTGAVTLSTLTPTAIGAITSLSGATYSHVEFFITKTTTAASTITLAAFVATVGVPAVIWAAGEGHSGVEFLGQLGHTNYQAMGLGRKIMAMAAVEVGSWL